jgi:uncharacterized membrane protein
VSVNVSGDIAGSYVDGAGITHGFVRLANGSITSFDVLGATGTAAVGINAAGQIVGSYVAGQTDHGFFRAADGTITTFDAPNGTNTVVTAINDSGSIAGTFTNNTNGQSQGFLRTSDGVITEFEGQPTSMNSSGVLAGMDNLTGWIRAPDGTVTTFSFLSPLNNQMAVSGINDSGVVVGSNARNYCFFGCTNPRGEGALRTPDGQVTFFRIRDENTTVAGINASGQIVGTYWFDAQPFQAFLRNLNGAVTTFDVSGSYTYAWAVNANGLVTGAHAPAIPDWHGYLRIP